MQMANRIAIVVTTFANLGENALLVFHFLHAKFVNYLFFFFAKRIVDLIDSCSKGKFSLLKSSYFVDTSLTGFSRF